jgi:predicted flap endonuclease-1-like 5' DNA nuclease
MKTMTDIAPKRNGIIAISALFGLLAAAVALFAFAYSVFGAILIGLIVAVIVAIILWMSWQDTNSGSVISPSSASNDAAAAASSGAAATSTAAAPKDAIATSVLSAPTAKPADAKAAVAKVTDKPKAAAKPAAAKAAAKPAAAKAAAKPAAAKAAAKPATAKAAAKPAAAKAAAKPAAAKAAAKPAAAKVATKPKAAKAATKPKAAKAAAKPAAAKAAAKPAAAKAAAKPAAAKAAAKPKATKPAAAKPAVLAKARTGGPDDLKMIKGVGPVLEKALHETGVFHFDQVGAWTNRDALWFDDNVKGANGRVVRDGWIKQARILAKGGTTEFSNKVKKGGVY